MSFWTGFLSQLSKSLPEIARQKEAQKAKAAERQIAVLSQLAEHGDPETASIATAGLMRLNSGKMKPEGNALGKLFGSNWEEDEAFGTLRKMADWKKQERELAKSREGKQFFSSLGKSAPHSDLEGLMSPPTEGAAALPIDTKNNQSQIDPTKLISTSPMRPAPTPEPKLNPSKERPIGIYDKPGVVPSPEQEFGHLRSDYGMPTPEFNRAIAMREFEEKKRIEQQYAKPTGSLQSAVQAFLSANPNATEADLKQFVMENAPAGLARIRGDESRKTAAVNNTARSEEKEKDRVLKEKLAKFGASASLQRALISGKRRGELTDAELESIPYFVEAKLGDTKAVVPQKLMPYVAIEINKRGGPGFPKPIVDKLDAYTEMEASIDTLKDAVEAYKSSSFDIMSPIRSGTNIVSSRDALSKLRAALAPSVGRAMSEKGQFALQDQQKFEGVMGPNEVWTTLDPDEMLRRIDWLEHWGQQRKLKLLEGFNQRVTGATNPAGIVPPPVPPGMSSPNRLRLNPDGTWAKVE